MRPDHVTIVEVGPRDELQNESATVPTDVKVAVDLDALVEISVWMAGELGRPSPSRVVTALLATRDREE